MQTDPFRAIADPTRRQILDLLSDKARGVGELTGALGISQPAVSQQLKLLAGAGLVRAAQDGRRRIYSVEAANLAEVADWLARYEAFWDDRLNDLGEHLDRHIL